jgi:hypothetical protein
MSDPPVRWQKVWFFLRNNVDAPLPMVTGSSTIPQPMQGKVWPRGTSTGYSPYGMLSNSYYQVG